MADSNISTEWFEHLNDCDAPWNGPHYDEHGNTWVACPEHGLRWIERPDPDPTVKDAIPERVYPFEMIADYVVVEEAA